MAEKAKRGLMLTELDVVVFLKSGDDLDKIGELVFGVLRMPYDASTSDEFGGRHFVGSGLGFRAVLYPNQGEMADPEFEGFEHTLNITSHYWCVDLDAAALEGPLSEYFARQLAFELNLETATEVLVETTDESEISEIRSYRRNPQYRLDQAPTTPKVFMIEARRVEEPFTEGDEEEEYAESEGAEPL